MKQEGILKFIIPLLAALGAWYFARAYLQTPDLTALFLLGAVLLGITMAKPLYGIIIYLVYLPFLGESSGLSVQEFIALGIIVLLCVLWFISRSKKWSQVLEINRIERSLVILFLYLLFSLLVGAFNGVTFVDWGRDMFPLLHLALILPVVHFINNERDFQLVFTVFVIALAVPIIEWFLGSLIQAGLLSYLKIFWLQGTPFAMYILIILGIVSFVEYRKVIPLYFIPAISAVGVALLNHPRTVWVGTSISMLVIFFLTQNKIRWLGIILVGILSIFIFLSFLAAENPAFFGQQMHWVNTLSNLGGDLSWQSRLAEGAQTFGIFYQHPIFGVGLGYQYHFWRPFIHGIGPGYMDTNMTHSDSTNYLAKTGLVGVLMLIFFFYNAVYLGIKFYNQSADRQSRMVYLLGACSVIVALIVANSTPILQIRYNASALAFVIAFIFARKKLEQQKEEEQEPPN
ncbi:MAG: O-antigen ligase family protein [Candidatus Margulisiibacteriota bacterium]